MKDKLCAIVVPIYKEKPTLEEIASLKQLFNILSNYPIIFICAKGFNSSFYKENIERQFAKEIVLEEFNPSFFKSIDGYNSLMLSPKFYKRFINFQFILIYQLDAWVFSDQLEYWCKKNFDYIGAPWFENWDKADANSKFIGVGNGGLSLRKISTHIRALKSFNYIDSPHTLFKNFIKKPGLKPFLSFVKNMTLQNNTHHLLRTKGMGINEDYFWGLQVAKCTTFFKVPNMETALKFSMENKAPILFEMNNNELPFGCHAWEKYNADFWQKFIKV